MRSEQTASVNASPFCFQLQIRAEGYGDRWLNEINAKTVNFLLAGQKVRNENVNIGNAVCAPRSYWKFIAFDDGIVTNDNGLHVILLRMLRFRCNCSFPLNHKTFVSTIISAAAINANIKLILFGLERATAERDAR